MKTLTIKVRVPGFQGFRSCECAIDGAPISPLSLSFNGGVATFQVEVEDGAQEISVKPDHCLRKKKPIAMDMDFDNFQVGDFDNTNTIDSDDITFLNMIQTFHAMTLQAFNGEWYTEGDPV